MVLAGCSGSSTTSEADDAGAASTTPSASTAAAADSSTTTPTTFATTRPETTVAPTTVAPDARPMPTDPAGLALAIGEAEIAVRDPSVDTDTARAWGRRLQLLYRVLAANETWADEVLASVVPAVADDVASNWSARQHLTALVTSTRLATEMPVWRIREPLPVEELLELYRAAEDATGVPWEYLASINLIETRMGRIEGLSTAGAVGPMQFLPSTWEGCCEGDPTVDADAIMGAAVYLTQVGAPADLDGALFSYNRSSDYVEAVKDYADVMARNELAYRGYHAYEVFFRSAEGLVVLRPGYYEPEPVDAATWIQAHPEAVIPD